MPWGAAIGAAVGLYAANKQSKSAKDAANTQSQAAKDSNQVQLQIYNQQRADNEPFRQNALTAQQEYMNLLGLGHPQSVYQPQGQPAVSGVAPRNPFGGNPKRNGIAGLYEQPEPYTGAWQQPAPQAVATTPMLTPEQQQQAAFNKFRNTPGYQFGLQTGFDQVQASAAARGGLYSGATLKALDKFGRDYADQQGYTPYMNSLANLAGMGQVANSQNAAAGQNYANQTGYNLTNAANARASGITQSANTWGQAASGIAGLIGKYWPAGGIGGVTPGYGTATGNYNWASTSGFGNNWGNF